MKRRLAVGQSEAILRQTNCRLRPPLAIVHRVLWKRLRGRRPVEKRLPDLHWTLTVAGVGSTIVRAFAGLPLRSFPTFSEVYQSIRRPCLPRM